MPRNRPLEVNRRERRNRQEAKGGKPAQHPANEYADIGPKGSIFLQ